MAKDLCEQIQESVPFCEGRTEFAGIRRRIYYTSKANIVKYAQLPTNAAGIVTSAILQGDFELKEGAFWRYIDIVAEKSQTTSDSQGDPPSQTSLNKGTFIHPGVGEEASMLAAYVQNNNCIYVFEDIAGRAHVIGCEMWPVKSAVAQDFGQGASGSTSTTVTVEGTDKVPFPRYIGLLHTEEGDIQCLQPEG